MHKYTGYVVNPEEQINSETENSWADYMCDILANTKISKLNYITTS